MKPVAFEYASPTTVAEAVQLLAEHGEQARVLAGGQSLVPLLNRRIVRPGILVDINRVPELTYQRHEDGTLELGAMVRHEAVARSMLVQNAVPLLTIASGHIAHLAVRSRGSFGGSLAHADPGAELPTVAMTLDATFHSISSRGARVLSATEFFRARNKNGLAPDELLVGVRVPELTSGTGYAFEELSLRFHHAPVVAAAAVVRVGSDGNIIEVRIGLAGVAEIPIRAWPVERSLVGQAPTETLAGDAAATVAKELDPPGDVHASPTYRRRLAQVLVRRTLQSALEQAVPAP